MGRLIFSPQSKEDLKEIYAYIKRDSAVNAKRVRKTIIEESKKLIIFPEIGREVIKTSKDSIRQILVYRYRIFYRIIEDDIEIVSIFHSSRLIQNNPGLQGFFEE